ncbi:unnamed protein product [Paramecium sonneborni]|uniref:EF-hand domain-containing protein n=1 Tax=Paramecium sonneborni TaxID=65129 RepID=A0A8S1M320_9CILI|nr:unnamed protein product [Paramecium sonneborni]
MIKISFSQINSLEIRILNKQNQYYYGQPYNNSKNDSFRKNTSPLLNVTLSKLRDYHASFKSICDNFSMDLSELEHIFGASERAFVIWDTDNNGLIDSLELFSGICIFSDTKFDDKIRFLFDLFDFNELESLSPTDIEFMINCCMKLTVFATKYFEKENRLTVVELIKASKNSPEVNDFFQIIKKDLIEKADDIKIQQQQQQQQQF